ncbi:class 1b ribonucleoside-diphosphate reductase subunit beta [Mammaliicoccus sciuri]|jgi:ribonucleoside-diphosphate reductase beta chain|uniref:ribonucleoside-diphosphate reductase n=1 Tax=Mammaliicoccus sciuri TaxID=1296 RepID=A0AAI8DJN4_MAMSC|nr:MULTISPECIES: class 1b ribonucleoside-diphosphate reductase subunit beta [Mammaliicoccus]OOV36986.1 class 1b ribonucleoside-diphosphate reductase subunit beta [Staphylococcus sp. MB371]HCW35695.1 class 1b ribonucleoside-diphosphate reductase subunit beta [Staphylococcus sp.]ASE34868.1 class 1b ribonucleoside-diphosphate reductase subunit beta [Mammaliicoccus sciuri]KTT82582.1 ribonucleotide-diphosphate reductase subunit beta [Mammaliicoccus sciuri]KTT86137.1 ribonucleotide-diphosphate reduc
MKAVNWNTQEDMTNMFWRQNISQMWVESEFKVSKDIASWETLTEPERNAFKKALAGLTGLDTHQADDGMPLIMMHTKDLRKKAVYSFMGMMEQIHAKSYSHIFTTLLPSSETNELLDKWVVEEPHLKYKSEMIVGNYHKLWGKEASIYDQYMARVSSVFLETFLFYSGFYYPLYLAGQGRMTTSGEIIRKILLDESIHGVFTGLDAQSLKNELSQDEQIKADREMYRMLDLLYKNEYEYTKTLYDEIGLTNDVMNYVTYNANKALANLGFEPYYEEKAFNPIIENALNTSTKNHDFFSVKGDGYVLALNVEALKDEDFIFDEK